MYIKLQIVFFIYAFNAIAGNELDFVSKNIEDVDLAALTQANKNTLVSRINLTSNASIGEDGIKRLAELLQVNWRINELYLERVPYVLNNYKNEHVLALKMALDRNKNIHNLNLQMLDDTKVLKSWFSFKQKLGIDVAFHVFSYLIASYLQSPFTNSKPGLGEFISIAGGEHCIGQSPQNAAMETVAMRPLFEVDVKPFSIMQSSVDQKTFIRWMNKNPALHKLRKYCPLSYETFMVGNKRIQMCSDFPVENLSLPTILEFIERLNEWDRIYTYRLPTAAELEVANRAGNKFYYANHSNDFAGLEPFEWFKHPMHAPQTHPVKSIRKNAFGIYRSSVSEWTEEIALSLSDNSNDFREYYACLGGSEKYSACRCHLTANFPALAKSCDPFTGFRLVRELKKKTQKKPCTIM